MGRRQEGEGEGEREREGDKGEEWGEVSRLYIHMYILILHRDVHMTICMPPGNGLGRIREQTASSRVDCIRTMAKDSEIFAFFP